MDMPATDTRYSRLMIAVHWSTAILVLIAYILSEGGPGVRTDPPRLHFIFGMAVLLLVLPRLIARLLGGAPAPREVGGKWLTFATKFAHGLLYLLLIAVPLTGWYAMSRVGVTFSLFGFSLPAMTAPVEGFPGPVGELHQLGGNGILSLAGLHGVLALWHHFVRKDDTLRRMSPF